MKILFVCMGNICRSPLAEGILKHKLKEKKLKAKVESAGLESFYINESPDERAVMIAKKHGIDISGFRCRLFKEKDFDKFDTIYVMEMSNHRDLSFFARNEKDMEKVKFLMSEVYGKNKKVPDPYMGDMDGFEKTFSALEKACDKIIETIEKTQPAE